MRCYINTFRAEVDKVCSEDALDQNKNVFVTWSFKPLNGFSKQLDSFWRKATKSNRPCPISATLARKSITTTFYAHDETDDKLKARLTSHMKHKPETAAKNYNLIKTLNNAAALTNKIESTIFGTTPSVKKGEEEEASEFVTDEIQTIEKKLPNVIRKSWSKEELDEIIRLFGNHNFNCCYIPYIRSEISSLSMTTFSL